MIPEKAPPFGSKGQISGWERNHHPGELLQAVTHCIPAGHRLSLGWWMFPPFFCLCIQTLSVPAPCLQTSPGQPLAVGGFLLSLSLRCLVTAPLPPWEQLGPQSFSRSTP